MSFETKILFPPHIKKEDKQMAGGNAQGEKRNEFTMIILIIIIIVKKEGKCHTHKDEKRRGSTRCDSLRGQPCSRLAA